MLPYIKNKVLPAIRFALVAALIALPAAAFAQDGDLTHFRLKNGLNVFVKEDHARKVAAIQMWVRVGSAYENDSERGISHVIEHMAFKGTKTRGVGQIAKEVEEIGGRINAYTSWDETVFHIIVPSSEISHGIDLVTDAVLRPVIDPKQLENEKKVVLEEILEDKDRPSDVAFNGLLATAYTTSPYRFPVIGHKDIVEKITRNMILDFRSKWYVPENMFLLVVGDVDPGSVRKDVERFTSDIKPTPFFRPSLSQEPRQTQIRGSLIRDVSSTQTHLDLAFHIPSMKGNDANALDLAADILGGRDDSRLVTVLKQDKGLVNSISASTLTLKDSGLMIVSATLDAKNLQAATRAVMEQLTDLAKTPPSPEELKQALTHIESQHVYDRETVQGTAESMGTYENQIQDVRYGEKYLMLNSAVKPRQISTVVAKYLVPTNATVGTLLPDGEAKDFQVERLEKIVSGFTSISKGALSQVGAQQRPLFRELSNGMRVVLVPDESNPVLSARIIMMGGKRWETQDTQGIMNFISSTLDKGAGNMTQLDIARKVDDIGGTLDGFAGYDSFGLYASYFSRYWDQGLQLLFQLYSDPTFPSDKVQRERELILNRIKTEPDNPTQYVIKILNKEVFPDSPYGFDLLGTPATVSGFTAEDLKRTYHRFAVPSNTVIAVVGRMDTQKVSEEIDRLFGSIPAKELEVPRVKAEQPLEKISQTVLNIPRAKARLAIGFQGTALDDPDRYPLEVLDNVLAGQGGRLFRQLRDNESLAYTVTSFMRSGLSPGVFGFYLACDPPKVDRAYKGLINQIELVKQAKVSDAELKKAINNLVGNHLISRQSSSDRAEAIGYDTLSGQGYDFDPKYIKKIREVKAEDVLRVARKYLDLEHCAVVKIVPDNGVKETQRNVSTKHSTMQEHPKRIW